MHFVDVIKRSVLEGFQSRQFSKSTIFVSLAITCVFAIYIFLMYRTLSRKTFYVKSFNISMSLISIITAALILAISSNIVISLGMVGALSIVRFRTAIKDPLDLIFLFWSISTGIICGAQIYVLACVLAIVLTLGFLILSKLPLNKSNKLLIVNSSDKTNVQTIMSVVQTHTTNYTVKSKSIMKSGADLIIEIRSSKEDELVDILSDLKDVTNVSILEYSQDIESD
jgi:uncharacterized membrane protein YhiD involved in acid resistance